MATQAHSMGAKRPHVPTSTPRTTTQAEIDRAAFLVANAALAAGFVLLTLLG